MSKHQIMKLIKFRMLLVIVWEIWRFWTWNIHPYDSMWDERLGRLLICITPLGILQLSWVLVLRFIFFLIFIVSLSNLTFIAHVNNTSDRRGIGKKNFMIYLPYFLKIKTAALWFFLISHILWWPRANFAYLLSDQVFTNFAMKTSMVVTEL